MVGVFERVFEIGSTYRAEQSATTRHLSEFLTIDAEMGFIEFIDLQKHMGDLLLSVVERSWADHETVFKQWNTLKPTLPESSDDIPRITIDEIHEMFFKATKEDHREEGDLAPAEEKWICQWAKKNKNSEAVFVTGWSAKDKTFKFYHRANQDDPAIADRADLLFRGIEITTLSMRQHRYDILVEQLRAMGGDPEDPGFVAYISAFKYGMPPHGGFGLGFERLIEKLFSLNNVKEATLFPRDINRLAP